MLRRSFIRNATLMTGAVAFAGGIPAHGREAGANTRLRIAVAGLRGRGKLHIAGWLSQPNVEIAYLIDPDRQLLERSLHDLKQKAGAGFAAKGVSDARRALEDPHVDAISIATPNHWHALMTIWAAQAGKHVYVEKPMSHDVAEGRAVVEAQKKYGIVIQHGAQLRSDAKIAGLHEAIRSGRFGRLKIAYAYCCKPRPPVDYRAPAAIPDHLDWNLWRGHAHVEYHPNLVHYNWRWFWRIGNGDINNQGSHQLDVARWALDPDLTCPVRTMALGGRFKWGDQGETPNTAFAIAEYPNGQFVFLNVRTVNYDDFYYQIENEYYFEDGGRIVRDTYYPKGSKQGEKLTIAPGEITPGGNWGSFVKACRAGKPEMANGTAKDGHLSSVLGHVMNHSYRLGVRVPFNARAGRFGDNADAYQHFMKLHALTRESIGLPENEAEYTVGPWLTFNPETERHTGAFANEANALLADSRRPGFELPRI